MKNLILLFSLALISLSCAKKENNNNVPVNQYVSMNGACFDQTNNIYVAQNLCSNLANNGYTLQANGICIQNTTGQQVPLQNCQSNTLGQQCIGQYYFFQANTAPQLVTCSNTNAGNNCRGFTLISQITGQQVICQ